MVVKIDRVTVAVNDMPGMVYFYNSVFDAGMRPVEPRGEFAFHVGRLAGLELFFCPNAIPQIEAEKNRQQLRLVVMDLPDVIETAIRAGGQKIGNIRQTDNTIEGGITDPDGNSIELIEYL